VASSEERRLIQREAAIRAELDRRKTPSQRQAEATGYVPGDGDSAAESATARQVRSALRRDNP